MNSQASKPSGKIQESSIAAKTPKGSPREEQGKIRRTSIQKLRNLIKPKPVVTDKFQKMGDSLDSFDLEMELELANNKGADTTADRGLLIVGKSHRASKKKQCEIPPQPPNTTATKTLQMVYSTAKLKRTKNKDIFALIEGGRRITEQGSNSSLSLSISSEPTVKTPPQPAIPTSKGIPRSTSMPSTFDSENFKGSPKGKKTVKVDRSNHSSFSSFSTPSFSHDIVSGKQYTSVPKTPTYVRSKPTSVLRAALSPEDTAKAKSDPICSAEHEQKGFDTPNLVKSTSTEGKPDIQAKRKGSTGSLISLGLRGSGSSIDTAPHTNTEMASQEPGSSESSSTPSDDFSVPHETVSAQDSPKKPRSRSILSLDSLSPSLATGGPAADTATFGGNSALQESSTSLSLSELQTSSDTSGSAEQSSGTSKSPDSSSSSVSSSSDSQLSYIRRIGSSLDEVGYSVPPLESKLSASESATSITANESITSNLLDSLSLNTVVEVNEDVSESTTLHTRDIDITGHSLEVLNPSKHKRSQASQSQDSPRQHLRSSSMSINPIPEDLQQESVAANNYQTRYLNSKLGASDNFSRNPGLHNRQSFTGDTGAIHITTNDQALSLESTPKESNLAHQLPGGSDKSGSASFDSDIDSTHSQSSDKSSKSGSCENDPKGNIGSQPSQGEACRLLGEGEYVSVEKSSGENISQPREPVGMKESKKGGKQEKCGARPRRKPRAVIVVYDLKGQSFSLSDIWSQSSAGSDRGPTYLSDKSLGLRQRGASSRSGKRRGQDAVGTIEVDASDDVCSELTHDHHQQDDKHSKSGHIGRSQSRQADSRDISRSHRNASNWGNASYQYPAANNFPHHGIHPHPYHPRQPVGLGQPHLCPGCMAIYQSQMHTLAGIPPCHGCSYSSSGPYHVPPQPASIYHDDPYRNYSRGERNRSELERVSKRDGKAEEDLTPTASWDDAREVSGSGRKLEPAKRRHRTVSGHTREAIMKEINTAVGNDSKMTLCSFCGHTASQCICEVHYSYGESIVDISHHTREHSQRLYHSPMPVQHSGAEGPRGVEGRLSSSTALPSVSRYNTFGLDYLRAPRSRDERSASRARLNPRVNAFGRHYPPNIPMFDSSFGRHCSPVHPYGNYYF